MATISNAELRAISEAATARALGRLKVEQAVERLDAADLFEAFATSRATRLGSNLAEAAPSPVRPDAALAELSEDALDGQLADLVNEVQEVAQTKPPRSAVVVPASKGHAQAEIAESWLDQLGVPKAAKQPVTESVADPRVQGFMLDYYTRFVA